MIVGIGGIGNATPLPGNREMRVERATGPVLGLMSSTAFCGNITRAISTRPTDRSEQKFGTF
jgi:hypothetical protein